MSWDDIERSIGEACVGAFGEEEPLTLLLPGGVERAVVGIVDREVPMKVRAVLGAQMAKVLITVRNHDTLGIPTASVDLGTWKVKVAVRIGGAVETLRFVPRENPVSQDAGCATYALQ